MSDQVISILCTFAILAALFAWVPLLDTIAGLLTTARHRRDVALWTVDVFRPNIPRRPGVRVRS